MISETDLLWWLSLHKARSFRDVRAVCDFGQQEVQWHSPCAGRTVQAFAAACGVTPPRCLTHCRTSADLWRGLGREIVSIDIEGSGPDFRRMDLNRETAPDDLRGRFDFVTNIGTSEHVLNQYNVMEVMHDLTRHRGVMVHAVPSCGYAAHGLVNYNLKFFSFIANANGYEVLDLWLSIDAEAKPFPADLAALLRDDAGMFRNARNGSGHPIEVFGDLVPKYQARDGAIYAAFRKSLDEPFKAPLDLRT